MKYFKHNLTQPSLRLAGLKIWIHDRQFPESDDYWDGNWLNVTANCVAQGADILTSGSLIHLSEIKYFLSSIEKINASLAETAELTCIEPELTVVLETMPLGQIFMVVDISPDSCSQQHQFKFQIDQSDLPNLIQSCQEVLNFYPIKSCVQ